MSEDLTDIDNKAAPRLRVHQLNETSSRYDRMAAAPPDETLVKYWLTWAVIALLVGTFTLIIFLSIVSNKKVRQKPFNLLLVYLLVPDIIFSLLCGTTCLMNAINGSYFSRWMCDLQNMYVVFGLGANPWINALIARHIYMMLKSSHQRRHYQLPTTRSITCQCLSIYAYSVFLGSLALYGGPFHSGQMSGLACGPTEVDLTSTLLFWILFFPAWFVIPALYTIWVGVAIYIYKLLPPSGKRRDLSIYFGRLLFIFIFMWIPALFCLYFLSSWLPQLSFFGGGTWSHLQPLVSSIFTLMKPDIKEVFVNFIRCRCCGAPPPASETASNQRSNTASAESLDEDVKHVRNKNIHIFHSEDLSILPDED